MKTLTQWILVLAAVAGLGAGMGYWLGQYASPPAAAASPTLAASAPRQPLYYRNPMGLPDTSPVPKKDSMGMDYLPVYADDNKTQTAAPSPLGVSVSPEKIQQLGVRTEAVQRRVLDKLIHANARVDTDERRVSTVTAKFEGYVERLLVNATGQWVAKGQTLFEVYSPEMVSAQREYQLAVQGQERLQTAGAGAQNSMQQLADSALTRLKNWDLSEDQINRLRHGGAVQHSISFHAPSSGYVTEKKVQQGMRIMPGDALYQLADLSSVWVVAEVPEQDLASVRVGSQASIRINAYPDHTLAARVSYVDSRLNPDSRTVAVRMDVPNPQGRLKPGMYAQAELSSPAAAGVLVVPESAVIDSGTRTVVLAQTAPGHFEPRPVSLGQRSAGWVQVLQGVAEGDLVVVAANFLIDSESNLKAALVNLSTQASASAPATTASA